MKKLLFLLLFALCAFPASAQVRPYRGQSRWPDPPPPKLQTDRLPIPPLQNQPAPWKDTPPEVAEAADALFKLGLADPRGCEYREVQLVFGNPDVGGGTPVSVHAWLLPEKDRGQRFAVAWNGLVYPVWGIGPEVSLAQDARDFVAYIQRDSGGFAMLRFTEEESAASHSRPLALKAVYLWRLGFHDVAEQIWKSRWARISDPYHSLAEDWLWQLFQRAACAHRRGDDRLALLDAELLTQTAPVAQAEVARQDANRPENAQVGRSFLNFLRQLPDLLADSRQRLQPKSRPAPASLEADIQNLEDVGGSSIPPTRTRFIGEDPRVQVLVNRGDAAVEPLLTVMETDHRLTRSIETFGRAFTGEWELTPVSYTAYLAITQILHKRFPIDDPEYNRRLPMAQVAPVIRAYWQRIKDLPLEERWFMTLQDDAAPAADWLEAAENVTSALMPVGTQTDQQATRPVLTGLSALGRPLQGEKLRAHQHPSFSELLTRRSDQLAATASAPDADRFALRNSVGLALALYVWDREAARPVLVRRLEQIIEATASQSKASTIAMRTVHRVVPDVVKALRGSGDTTAWSLFARWLREADSRQQSYLDEDTFRFALLHQAEPPIADALEAIYNAPGGVLYDVMGETAGALLELERNSELLNNDFFRRQALRRLGDTSIAGSCSLELRPDGAKYIVARIGHSNRYFRAGEAPNSPVPGQNLPFRVCDYYAYLIARSQNGPACELYWPEARRNAAVVECRRWLEGREPQ